MNNYKEEGIEIGEKQKAIKTAKLMLKNNEPVNKIIEYTGLSKKEIENLKLQ